MLSISSFLHLSSLFWMAPRRKQEYSRRYYITKKWCELFSWFVLNISKCSNWKLKHIIRWLLSSYHVTVMIKNSWAFVSSSSSPSFEVSSCIAFLLERIIVTNHIFIIRDKKSIFNSNSTSTTFPQLNWFIVPIQDIFWQPWPN